MKQYLCLFTEVERLKKDLKDYNRGLITYEELNQRLINIMNLIDYLLDV